VTQVTLTFEMPVCTVLAYNSHLSYIKEFMTENRSYNYIQGSVQFSTNIYNAQLSRMSHCASVARKPICFEFMPEAAVGDILIA